MPTRLSQRKTNSLLQVCGDQRAVAMDSGEVVVERGRGGILKGKREAKPAGVRPNNAISNADSSSISSVHSISTQGSVYAPIFNPTAKPTSDYYDSIDSDSSTLARNGGLRLKAGSDRRLNLGRPPNLTPVHAEATDPTLPPNSRRVPSNDDLLSVQGYLSDASSTSSSMRPGLKPRLDSQSSISSDVPKPLKSPSVIASLSFKERNFNFDLENESLTSAMGVQAFQGLYGDTSRPPLPPLDAGLSSSHTQTPTSTTNSDVNGGLIASQRLPPRKPSATNGVVGPRAFDTIQDINTPASTNISSLRQSSVSSSSLLSKVPLDFSISKRIEPSAAQAPSEPTTDVSSEAASSEYGEAQGTSLEKTLKMGTKGTFLLCIPKGICMLDGTGKSAVPRLMGDNAMIAPSNPVKSLWADAYQPISFNECQCHVQQAEFLRQLISQGNCPHLFFHGTSNYGKKLLIKVLLREIYGPSAWKVFQEKREFKKKGEKKVMKQLLASKYHVELDAEDLAENARTILVGLCKEIAHNMESSRVIANGENYETTFKVIVIYQIDKLSNDTQQLLRWLMDRYGDTCKLLLCSNHDSNILDSVKARCQNLCVDPPSQQEIVNFLQVIARKENLRVSHDFMVLIAYKSNGNLRHAIESLEALKPPRQGQDFKEELPIPTGWEDTVVEVASEILTEQTPKRMFTVRQKLQSLLQKQVPPQLILQSMVLELVKKMDNQLTQETCYWHGIYNKRLYSSSFAIDKLEEFVARIMSIYKKYKKQIL